MRIELDVHLEIWTFVVVHQETEYVVTIKRNLEDDEQRVWWVLASDDLDSPSPLWISNVAFLTPEDALADAERWIQESIPERAETRGT